MFKSYLAQLPATIQKRAQDVLSNGLVILLRTNDEKGEAHFKVKSESVFDQQGYQVKLTGLDEGVLSGTCSCDYYLNYGPCKHLGACALKLEKSEFFIAPIDKPLIASGAPDQRFTLAPFLAEKAEIDKKGFRQWVNQSQSFFKTLSFNDKFKLAELIEEISFSKDDKDQLHFTLSDRGRTHRLVLNEYDDKGGKLSCDCSYAQPCVHVYAVLFRLMRENSFGLLKAKDKRADEEIAHYLKKMRLPLSSYYKQKVEAVLNLSGNFELTLTDSSLSALIQLGQSLDKTYSYSQNKLKESSEKPADPIGMAYFLELNPFEILHYSITARIGKLKKNGEISKSAKILEEKLIAESLFQLELNAGELKTALKCNKLFSKFYNYELNDAALEEIESEEEEQMVYRDIIYKQIVQMLPQIAEDGFVVVSDSLRVNTKLFNNLPEKIEVSLMASQLTFKLKKNNTSVAISPYIIINEQAHQASDLSKLGYGLFLFGEILYHLNPNDASTLEQFGYKPQNMDWEEYEELGKLITIPLLKKHTVEFEGLDAPALTQSDQAIKLRIYLNEKDDFLYITPTFIYQYNGGVSEVPVNPANLLLLDDAEGKEVLLARNLNEEEDILEQLRAMHPDFELQRGLNSLSLAAHKVMKNNWFLYAFEEWGNSGVEVLGHKDLKRLKYNPNKPKLSMRAGSGIDWFDLQVTLTFGDQVVSLAELRKAVIKGENYIRLGDGSLGILPEEWLDKYALVLKTGRAKGDKLQFSAAQYGIIDQLYEEINENDKLINIHNKLQLLKNYKGNSEITVSKNITADLRDYQQEGFRWMHFLHETGWGGCLADDMGLGKTLQAISLIQTIIDNNAKANILVVVPTSLIFNWLLEVNKFAPQLKVLSYTGPMRSKNIKEFAKYNVILSTYGLIRQDVSILKEHEFDCIILDESQAIKNPDALVAKAVKLLRANQRFVMTGTPIENNTFDLYSQFDFINPGMLGSIESFRENYATAIDKFQDEAAAKALRKLIYPFMLSRKKEQVAKELPPKTETVIYCEMPPAQRKIYDDTKAQIKIDLGSKIEKDGLAKSGMYVFQGLMKLRQICNSPLLLNNVNITSNESVKMQVLLENLSALTAEGHKVLVFSFFVQMLELVGSALKRKELDYAWISGETSDRQAAVEKFKNESDCKVFLISLKAGGFGLNLTEADYVYLIDPWWNPAVEQQAIDRAHRIGQDKHIFAYKLVCKDTIEEKILQLQEKKKAVADELINIEQGILKKLDKNQILELFD